MHIRDEKINDLETIIERSIDIKSQDDKSKIIQIQSTIDNILRSKNDYLVDLEDEILNKKSQPYNSKNIEVANIVSD